MLCPNVCTRVFIWLEATVLCKLSKVRLLKIKRKMEDKNKENVKLALSKTLNGQFCFSQPASKQTPTGHTHLRARTTHTNPKRT